ncbi:MAG: O-antigen ligase family protein, partial [Lachnospiraceae bacterium]
RYCFRANVYYFYHLLHRPGYLKCFFPFLLAILLCFYIPNSGGQGITLPFNLTFILWIGMMLFYFALNQKYITTPAARPPQSILIGGGLLLLPWLAHAGTQPSVWVLLAALLFWYVLICLPCGETHKRFILRTIVFLAVCQGGMGLLQAFVPSISSGLMEYNWMHSHGRPYGIFQQINLLASFLATGIGCSFLLLLTTRHPLAAWGYLLVIGLLVFVLAINQSRAGALGAGLTALLMVGILWREAPWRAMGGAGIVILAALAGWFVTCHLNIMVNGVPYLMARSYESSTLERWNILRVTLQLILEKPWSGWGYGNFEYVFSRFVISHPELNYSYSLIVTHPHNELLYAWFQGGILALAGVLVLISGWVVMIVRAFMISKTKGAYTFLPLPLLMHLCLEYPFYQSFVHFALFLLLLRLGGISVENSVPVPKSAKRWWRGGYILAGTVLTVFSVSGLYANNQLTMLERHHLIDYPVLTPWYFATQVERARFDGMVALLVRWNHTHDDTLLDNFMQQAQKWSLQRKDRNVWQSMIMIAQYRGDVREAANLQSIYDKLFPSP